MSQIDPVLTADPPRFSETEAAALGGTHFGITADGAQSRQRAGPDVPVAGRRGRGARGAEAVQPGRGPGHAGHGGAGRDARRTGRPGPRGGSAPAHCCGGQVRAGAEDVLSRRARWEQGHGVNWVRAYDLLPGRARLDPRTLADPALVAWGETTARLGLALRASSTPTRFAGCRGTCSTPRASGRCSTRWPTPSCARSWSPCWTGTTRWSRRPGRRCVRSACTVT